MFLHMQKAGFSHAAQLSINLLTNSLQCGSFNAHKLDKKQGNKSDIVRGIARKVLNIFQTIFE